MAPLPRILLAIPVLLLYFGSETLLRNRIHPAALHSEEQAKMLIEHLPGFLRATVQHRREIRALRDRLDAAATPPERLETLTQLAAMHGGRRRRAVHRRIVRDCGDLPGAAHAVAAIAAHDLPPDRAVAAYLAFIERCRPAGGDEQRHVWLTGWGMVADYPAEARYAFLRRFAATGLLDAAFVRPWEDLRGLAVRRGDEDLLALARELERQCRVLAAGEGAALNPW